jgi:hypothetical protein
VNKPREHAVDAELFVEFTTCAIDMARKGQAAAKVRNQLTVRLPPGKDQPNFNTMPRCGPSQPPNR